MGFFSTLGNLVPGVAGSLLGALGGEKDSDRRTKRGIQLEDESYMRRAEYDWEKADERGLTPQEFYGSSAAGGSSSSSGNVLGNSATQLDVKRMDMDFQAREKQKDRETEIRKAEISAGATKYSANIQKMIADDKIDLSRKTFEQVTLPQAAAQIGLTEQETLKMINDVVTSTPDFVRAKILLQMGVENTIQTSLLQRLGVDITSAEAMGNLSDEQFQNLLSLLVAAGSITNRELQIGRASCRERV